MPEKKRSDSPESKPSKPPESQQGAVASSKVPDMERIVRFGGMPEDVVEITLDKPDAGSQEENEDC